MNVSSQYNDIKVTPLIGGRNESGVCTLLELGEYRLLLDCGCSFDLPVSAPSESYNAKTDNILHKISEDLTCTGGIDGVLISHADMHHIGALPVILGKSSGLNPQNMHNSNVPVLTTLPVFKFGQIMLYDYCLNRTMEGIQNNCNFDYDDIDNAFNNVMTMKYNQNVNMKEVINSRNKGAGKKNHQDLSIYCIHSGRTVGGSVFIIRYGQAEIVYAMDINLKKEIVLDGADLEAFPTGSELLIIDGSIHHMKTASMNVKRKRGDVKDEINSFLSTIMDTLRSGGNVLIPCETSGRILELLQILSKFWIDTKIGLYHLLFLSHMSHNVTEFGRMQLEWMSDSLSKGFYNGKPNPFELSQIKLASTIREVERKYSGPKVVLATCASLSFGLAKELLLQWGGDPRCKVIFIDTPDMNSLAAELLKKSSDPPLIVSVKRPLKVALEGDELIQYRKNAEKQKRIKEETAQRKRRQEELTQLNKENLELNDGEDDEDSGDESVVINSAVDPALNQLSLQRASSADDLFKKKKAKTTASNRIAKFLEPNFRMFESHDIMAKMDDYGVSNDDLKFQDIASTDNKWQQEKGDNSQMNKNDFNKPNQSSNNKPANHNFSGEDDMVENGLIGMDGNNLNDEINPTKTISSLIRMQFTCEFIEFNLSGTTDFKAFKTITSKIAPSRVLVLHANDNDCDEIIDYMKRANEKSSERAQIECYALYNNTTLTFQIYSKKLSLYIPFNLLPLRNGNINNKSSVTSNVMQSIQTYNQATSSLVDTKCSVCALHGTFSNLNKIESNSSVVMIRYNGPNQKEEINNISNVDNDNKTDDNDNAIVVEEEDEIEDDDDEKADEGKDDLAEDQSSKQELQNKLTVNQNQMKSTCNNSFDEQQLIVQDGNFGVISVGEVTLDKVKYLIESYGVSVEFDIGAGGGVAMICGGQVVVRKGGDNEFVIEGPPVDAFYVTRKALYQVFAFV
eukprot:gene14055-18853_t